MKVEAIHLGDGAYVTRHEDGNIVITANSHDPSEATDCVCIEPIAIGTLVNFLKGKIKGTLVHIKP